MNLQICYRSLHLCVHFRTAVLQSQNRKGINHELNLHTFFFKSNNNKNRHKQINSREYFK